MLRNVARAALPLPTLTAAILTLDEADRIEDCLRSVAFCDEVLVLDAGSRDATVEIARSLGARVEVAPWEGFVLQKNRAWSLATGDWVLSVDADERVDDELRRAIQTAVASGEADGYRVCRRNVWLGHRLTGGFAWPDRHIRLARRAAGRWEGRDPHDRLVPSCSAGRMPTIVDLAGELVHHSYRSLADHLARIDRYTGIDAREGTLLDIVLRPPWHFFEALVLRRGLRDGLAGVAYAALGALYVFLKWGRLRLNLAPRPAAPLLPPPRCG